MVIFTLEANHRVGGNAFHDENVGPNGAALANDRVPTEDGGIGINGNEVLYARMAFHSFHRIAVSILGEALGSQRDAMIQFHMLSNDGGFTNDDAGAVVDKEMIPNRRAWMDIDACSPMRPLGHHAWNEWHPCKVKFMGHALYGDGFHAGIGKNDLFRAAGGWIALISGGDVCLDAQTDFRELAEKSANGGVGGFREVLGWSFEKAQAAFYFIPHGANDPGNALVNFRLQALRMQRSVVKEPWEDKAEKFLAETFNNRF